jgi:putative ABC transport system permease protein
MGYNVWFFAKLFALLPMLLPDLLFTFRLLRKRPWTSLAVIVALLLGIGVSTAVFSVTSAVLLRPVPVLDPDRVVRVYAKVNRTGASMGISYPEFLDWKAQCHSFEAFAVMRAFSFDSADRDRPEHLKGTGISAEGFKVFGVSTSLGRGFAEDDDKPGSPRVVILNHRFWEQRFGSDPTVLGRILPLNGEGFTVIGVLQPTQVNVLQYPDVWVPNGPFLNARAMSRDIRPYFPAARLKSASSQNEARTELENIASRLAAQYPASNKDIGIRFVGLTELLTANDRQPVILLFTAALLIFVLTCLNVVIVLITWTAGRRKELAIRMSLGASRFQILRQLLLQAVVLVSVGSVLGLLGAKLTLTLFLHRFPNALIRFQETTFDYRVMCFLLLMVTAAAIVATVFPGWYTTRLGLGMQLKDAGVYPDSAHRRRVRDGALITFEVAVAASLLLISGLLIKSLYQVTNVDLGFNPHHAFSFQLNLPPRYKSSDQASFYMRALEKLSNVPALSRSSAISSLPLTTQANAISLETDTESHVTGNQLLVEDEAVLPRLFETLRVPILQGREFTNTDREGTPQVAIVDEVLAAKLWPGQTAIGKRIRLVEITGSQPPWREVVGVVREIRHFGPEAKVRWMQVYVPEYQDPSPVMSFVIETGLPEATVRLDAAKAIRELDAGIPLDNFQAMDDLLDGYLAGRKVAVSALSSFAAIAVVLALIGIYGVVANAAISRRREIAIRLALGATRGKTLVLLIQSRLIAGLAGLVFGFALVVSLTRTLSSFLFGVKPLDSSVYAITAVSIVLLTVAAAVLPARSVFYLHPTDILRE